MSGKYVTCEKCGSEMMIQDEWDDLCVGPQGIINRIERWHCHDCGRTQLIAPTYVMASYTVCEGENIDDFCETDVTHEVDYSEE